MYTNKKSVIHLMVPNKIKKDTCIGVYFIYKKKKRSGSTWIKKVLRLYIAFCASAITCFGTQESYIVKTSAKENPTATFRCRVPAQYDQASKVKYRLLVYFGGRNL